MGAEVGADVGPSGQGLSWVEMFTQSSAQGFCGSLEAVPGGDL